LVAVAEQVTISTHHNLVDQQVAVEEDLHIQLVAVAVEHLKLENVQNVCNKTADGTHVQDTQHIHQQEMKVCQQADQEIVEIHLQDKLAAVEKVEQVFTDLAVAVEDQDIMLAVADQTVAEQVDLLTEILMVQMVHKE
jgi:hypothetical protein